MSNKSFEEMVKWAQEYHKRSSTEQESFVNWKVLLIIGFVILVFLIIWICLVMWGDDTILSPILDEKNQITIN